MEITKFHGDIRSFKNPCVLGALLCLCGKINNESMEVRRIHGGVRKISFQLSG